MNFEYIEPFERWLPVVGYEGLYEVSDWGRVRSIGKRRGKEGRILSAPLDSVGYPHIQLSKEGKAKSFRVHRLVAEAFLGKCPITKEVDHMDGCRTNNTLVNLRYVTRSRNIQSAALKKGQWRVFDNTGEKNPKAKMTQAAVLEIRRLHLEGMGITQLAKEFAVTPKLIKRIITRETWKHI